MKNTAYLVDESERLKALLDLKILDTNPEKIYDDLVLLAAEICQAPVAAISLIDSERQWFKAKVGIEACETPREISFCTHAIQQQKEIFEVQDALLDPKFKDNPSVKGPPHLRFYAGVPLVLPNGYAVGTLCVVDLVARKLTEKQRQALQALGRQVIVNLNNNRNLEELKKAWAEVERINDRNKKIIESMSEGLVLQDQSGAIISHNSAALSILGLSSDQLLGKTSMDPDWKTFREDGSEYQGKDHPAMRCLQNGEEIRNDLMGLHTPNGKTKWISINATPIFTLDQNKPSSVLTTFADITDERVKSVQLYQTAKMSSLGVMAGGIAHEINTPLAIIRGKAQILQMRLHEGLSDPQLMNKDLEKIIETIDRIANIVKAMRLISREGKTDRFQNTSVKQIINDTLSLCQDRMKAKNIDLKLNYDDVFLDCRAGEISQVLLNVISNSIDAIENKPEKWIEIETKSDDKSVFINVIDSGSGIPGNILVAMMEPFFTTKEPGKGTGLGLSVSAGIIKSHNGNLYCDTNCKNTKMVIQLPIKQETSKVKAA